MVRETVLSASNLTIRKDAHEIIRVPLIEVFKGEFIGVAGPNGAGKSTLLKALAFLEPLSGGEVLFAGEPVKSSAEALRARRRMAMVFQDPLLLSGTVRDNVTIGLKLRGIPGRERVKRAGQWLDRLGISHLVARDVRTLSGGEAQRVSIARSMVLKPEVLFLDEPFTYLDTPTKAALIAELKEILAETGTTALMVTHDLTDLPYLADRMIVMIDGTIRQAGPPVEVLNYPRSLKVAEFLGIENLWLAAPTGDEADCCRVAIGEGGGPQYTLTMRKNPGQIAEGDKTIAMIRSEDIVVNPGQNPASPFMPANLSQSNLLAGEIAAVYPYGYYYRLRVRLGTGFEISATTGVEHFDRPPRRGEGISLYLPPSKIHLLAAAER